MGQLFSLTTALITSAITVTAGLNVFVFGQLALKFIIEPLADYRKLKSQISGELVFYSNIFADPVDINEENLKDEIIRTELKEAQLNLRKLASQLTGAVQVIPMHSLFRFLGIIPSKAELMNVSKNLIGISNKLWSSSETKNFFIQAVDHRKNEIIRILKLHQPI